MEVGRVGDLRIRDGSIVRLPPVGDRLYRWPNLSKKERPKVNCASRRSAVGRRVGTTKKNGLTRAGLLMEVARNTSTGPGALAAGGACSLSGSCWAHSDSAVLRAQCPHERQPALSQHSLLNTAIARSAFVERRDALATAEAPEQLIIGAAGPPRSASDGPTASSWTLAFHNLTVLPPFLSCS